MQKNLNDNDLKIESSDPEQAFSKKSDLSRLQWVQRLVLISYLFLCLIFVPYLVCIPIVVAYFKLSRVEAFSFAVLALGFFVGKLGYELASLFFLCILPSFVIGYSLEKGCNFGLVLFRSLATCVGGFLVFLLIFSGFQQKMPWVFLIETWGKYIEKLTWFLQEDSTMKSILAADHVKDVIDAFVHGFVGLLGMILLLQAALIIWFALRSMTGEQKLRYGIASEYFSCWVVSDLMVWPTIIFGALFVFGSDLWSNVGSNGLHIVLCVYFFQGISILQFFFDAFKIEMIFRSLGFMACFTFLLQHVIALGFFDQWFDFRAKMKQN